MLSLRFMEKLPTEVPSELKSFTLEKVRVDKSIFLDVLTRLGLMGGYYAFRWNESGGWTIGEREDARISVNQFSGAVRFWTRLSYDRALAVTFSIAETQIEEIARTFLRTTGFVETPVDQLTLQKIAYLRMQTGSINGEQTPEVILDAGVIFGREVEGIPVSGPGSHVMLNVLADESISAGTKVWRRLGGVAHTSKVLKPEYAVDQLSRRLRSQGLDRPVEVLRAQLCYFERGENDKQEYLEPAYAFVYQYVTEENQFVHKSAEVIPAIEGSRQLWNPRKRYAK